MSVSHLDVCKRMSNVVRFVIPKLAAQPKSLSLK